MIWICPKCKKQYDGIKLNGHRGELLGFITLNNYEPTLYCFNQTLYEEPDEFLLFEYNRFAFYCTNCHHVADKRTNETKKFIERLKYAFYNRKMISSLI